MGNDLPGFVSYLLDKAARDSDPALYAELIIDNVDIDVVRSQLTRTDIVDQLVMMNPGVGAYRVWFEALRTEVVGILTELDSEHIDPPAGVANTEERPHGDTPDN